MENLHNPHIKGIIEEIESHDEFMEVSLTEYGLISFRLMVSLDYELNSWSSNEEAMQLLEDTLKSYIVVKVTMIEDCMDFLSADIEVA